MCTDILFLIFCFKACPVGYEGEVGAVLCTSLGYTTKGDCKSQQYLNDLNANPAEWECNDCVLGGSCKGAINVTGIRPLFGWSACPTDLIPLNRYGEPTFEPCIFQAACEGAENPVLFNKFVDPYNTSTLDPAKQDNAQGSCASPYRPGSLLCAGCQAGYSHGGFAGGDGICLKCPTLSSNLTYAIIGVVFGIIATVVYVRITILDAGTLDSADGAKSIGLSFIQVLVLLSTFPISWPPIFIILFQVGGAVTTVGQHLVNIKCMWPAPGYVSEADVFYGMRLLWATLPVSLPLSCVIVWLLCSYCLKIDKLTEKMKASVVGLLHFV